MLNAVLGSFSKIHSCCLLLLLIPFVAAAATPDVDRSSEVDNVIAMGPSWQMAIYLGPTAIASDAASSARIGSSAFDFGFYAKRHINPNFALNLGFSFLEYSDKASFSVPVSYEGTSSVTRASSDASAMPIFGDVQYVLPIGTQKYAYFSAGAGVSFLLSSERDVPNCSNCPSEEIDINGGAYGIVEWGAQVGEIWGLGLAYRHYLSGDIESNIALAVAWGY